VSFPADPSKPPIHEVHDPASLNISEAMWYQAVATRKMDPSAATGDYIDVRDLAWAHVEALKKQEAGGQRFLLTAGRTRLQFKVCAAVAHGWVSIVRCRPLHLEALDRYRRRKSSWAAPERKDYVLRQEG
jgi:nucleoside-diphosphate-sugar epimerase